MSEQNLLQLERLLGQAGFTEDGGEDPGHRYALRRGLLNSDHFERHRVRQVWTRACSYTISAVVGGATAVVVVVGVMTIELDDRAGGEGLARGPAAFETQLVTASAEPQAYAGLDAAVESADAPVGFVPFSGSAQIRYVLEFARSEPESVFVP